MTKRGERPAPMHWQEASTWQPCQHCWHGRLAVCALGGHTWKLVPLKYNKCRMWATFCVQCQWCLLMSHLQIRCNCTISRKHFGIFHMLLHTRSCLHSHILFTNIKPYQRKKILGHPCHTNQEIYRLQSLPSPPLWAWVWRNETPIVEFKDEAHAFQGPSRSYASSRMANGWPLPACHSPFPFFLEWDDIFKIA